MNRASLGRRGEEMAVQLLKREGYRILKRNVRSRTGEIDSIAQHRKVICFVEVKTAREGSTVLPEDQVTPAKQKQLIRLAKSWLIRNQLQDQRIRFDVLALQLGSSGQLVQSRLIQGAFDASEI